MGFIGLFMFIAYFIFSASRKSEQNKVWAGMAKETAHQIATPLSSLMAWVELLKDKDGTESIVVEMGKDITSDWKQSLIVSLRLAQSQH